MGFDITKNNESKPKRDCAEDAVTRLLCKTWVSFEEFARNFTFLRIVATECSLLPGNWHGYTCTCYNFAKYYICSDVIACAYNAKTINFNDQWKVFLLTKIYKCIDNATYYI